MQKLKLLLPLALFLGAFFWACHEDDPLHHTQLANVAFAGQVIDENGDAIQGALVKAGSESSLTDQNGVFRLNPVRLPAAHATLSVSKPGYFNLVRPYIVEDGATQTVTLQLLEKEQVAAISATAGGAVNVPGGPKLTFPANAIADQNGNAYTGSVRVFARYLDPSDPNLGLFVPGDMTAENAADEEVFLATYGMVGVEIESPSGQKLQIAAGQQVELRMPIIASQAAAAPAEIPLWHYNEATGHWEEEGSAQKIGNEYVGNVSHFSFWNCDAPFPLIQVHGKIYLDNTDQPLANATVRITLLATNSSTFGWTDGNGCFGGCIPKDEALLLEVITPEECGGQVHYTQNIGPFSSEATLAPIILTSSQVSVVKISGQLVDCSAQAVSNGYVKVEMGGVKRYYFPDANGAFNFARVLCGSNPESGVIVGYDLTNLLESAPQPISTPPNEIVLGDIVVCSALTEILQYTLDGQSYTSIDPSGFLSGFGDLTQITSGQDSIQNTDYILIQFYNNGQTGNFPISAMEALQVGFNTQAANTLSTTVTAYGNVGDLIIGTFGGTFQDFGGNPHTINGTYRVIRE